MSTDNVTPIKPPANVQASGDRDAAWQALRKARALCNVISTAALGGAITCETTLGDDETLGLAIETIDDLLATVETTIWPPREEPEDKDAEDADD